MEWCIRKNMDSSGKHGVKEGSEMTLEQKLIDGVITDDPKKFREVCGRVEDEIDGKAIKVRKGAVGSVKTWSGLAMQLLVFEIFSRIFFLLARWKGRLDYPHEIKKSKSSKAVAGAYRS